MNLDPAETGARVRAARAYADLTRADLARASGLQPGVLKRMEAGARIGTTRDELHAVADACGVPRLFMVGGFGMAEELSADARAAIELLQAERVTPQSLRALAAALETDSSRD